MKRWERKLRRLRKKRKCTLKRVPSAETAVPAAVEGKEIKKSAYGEIKELAEASADKRPGWNSDYAQREEELIAAGVMSPIEKAKLDEELTGGRGTLLRKLSFRNMFGFLMKGGEEWKLANSAEGKIWKAKNLAYLVEGGNMSRQEYIETLQLEAADPKAAEAKQAELFKGKCDELSALVESPVFKEFQESLDIDSKRSFEEQYTGAFVLYRSGQYDRAMLELKGLLDSEYPFVSNDGSSPISRMVKMQKAGLIGDREMKRVFGKAERMGSNKPGDTEFSGKMRGYKKLEWLRGIGKVGDDKFTGYVDQMKEEPAEAAMGMAV